MSFIVSYVYNTDNHQLLYLQALLATHFSVWLNQQMDERQWVNVKSEQDWDNISRKLITIASLVPGGVSPHKAKSFSNLKDFLGFSFGPSFGSYGCQKGCCVQPLARKPWHLCLEVLRAERTNLPLQRLCQEVAIIVVQKLLVFNSSLESPHLHCLNFPQN